MDSEKSKYKNPDYACTDRVLMFGDQASKVT